MRSRWVNFLATDGEKPDRNRHQEFILEPGTTQDQIMWWWEECWRCAFGALDSLQPEDLGRSVLSIPRGGSAAFNAQVSEEHKKRRHGRATDGRTDAYLAPVSYLV
jgi:hypothetical protein